MQKQLLINGLTIQYTSSKDSSGFPFSGDFTIESEEEAFRYQRKIEESVEYQLGYQLKIGDTILTHFDSLPGQSGGRGRRKSKIFER